MCIWYALCQIRKHLLLIFMILLLTIPPEVLIIVWSLLRRLKILLDFWFMYDLFGLKLALWQYQTLFVNALGSYKSFVNLLVLSESLRLMLDFFLIQSLINFKILILFCEESSILAVNAAWWVTHQMVLKGLGFSSTAYASQTFVTTLLINRVCFEKGSWLVKFSVIWKSSLAR